MWKSIWSVVKNIDIAAFLCEETCRYCGQSVPNGYVQPPPGLNVQNGRAPSVLVGAHCMRPSIDGKRDDLTERDERFSQSEVSNVPKMSFVLENSARMLVQEQVKIGPPPICLCLKCSEKMWQSRPSLWSLPIVDQRQDDQVGTTSGTTRLLTVATAGMYEGPMQKLIRRLKYDDDRLVVADLGCILSRAYEMLLTAMPELLDDKDDIFLVPVPLHANRQRKRGYNQAELIAKEFAKLKSLRVENGVLIRKRKTRPQYGLGRQDRLRNIEGAFELGGKDIRNKTVIIVDDVFTSGATLTTCAALLTECGAKQVAAMAAARAPYDKSGR